ncbi:MetS family NSS transporter small subunit [Brassicibacter mesophilus]|jgi:hypothetical protein
MTIGAWIMLFLGAIFLYGGLIWTVSIARRHSK